MPNQHEARDQRGTFVGESAMQQNPIRITLALLTLLPAAIAANCVMTPIDVQPESKLWVSGTSTVRSFECQAGSFDAKLASTGTDAVAAVLAGEKAVTDVVVTVPVDKLDCRNG